MNLLRALVSGLFAACLAAPSASACFQWNPERTLFLNEVPGVDVAVVAKVTIMMVGESNISDEPIRYAVAPDSLPCVAPALGVRLQSDTCSSVRRLR